MKGHIAVPRMVICECGKEFEAHHNAVKFCPRCREYRRANRYKVLNVKYKEHNMGRIREYKNKLQKAHNDATLELASERYIRWGSDEEDFLSVNASTMTTRDIAFLLGRTYLGVMSKAFKIGVKLQTFDKMHGRLVTGKI